MTDPKPSEIIQAENFLKANETQEALEIVRKFQLTAWAHYFRMELTKALEIALQSKELIEKVGNDADIANNFFLLGHIYLLMGDFKLSLDFGMRSLKLRETMDKRSDIGENLSLVGLAHCFLTHFHKNYHLKMIL